MRDIAVAVIDGEPTLFGVGWDMFPYRSPRPSALGWRLADGATRVAFSPDLGDHNGALTRLDVGTAGGRDVVVVDDGLWGVCDARTGEKIFGSPASGSVEFDGLTWRSMRPQIVDGRLFVVEHRPSGDGTAIRPVDLTGGVAFSECLLPGRLSGFVIAGDRRGLVGCAVQPHDRSRSTVSLVDIGTGSVVHTLHGPTKNIGFDVVGVHGSYVVL